MEEVLTRYIASSAGNELPKKLMASLCIRFADHGGHVQLIFLVTYVVPEFAKLFENMNAKLPTPTIIMMAIVPRARYLSGSRWAWSWRELCSALG